MPPGKTILKGLIISLKQRTYSLFSGRNFWKSVSSQQKGGENYGVIYKII